MKEPPPLATPPPTYTGPGFLYGSIGSIASLSGYERVYVSGYGLVVGLHGTGSPDCPPGLRPLMIREIARGGFGLHSLGLGNLTPAQVLASDQTAVVQIEGEIPPGAPRGTRFDLLVSALRETSTTSLEHGILYSTDLQIGGLDLSRLKGNALAKGGPGSLFVNPFIEAPLTGDANDPRRLGYVLGGGVTTTDMPLRLVTSRPSLRLVHQIAERINSRFQHEPGDKGPLAWPTSETTINLRVLNRFRDNPQRMLDLLSHLYMDPTPQFVMTRSQELGKLLEDPSNHQHADDIAYAWEAMGRGILSVIRPYYKDTIPARKMAALQAGAGIGDAEAIEPLWQIASNPQGLASEQATVSLGRMIQSANPPNRTVVDNLRKLLDADDPLVRMAAYEALDSVDDASIQRRLFYNAEVTQVICNKPMIFAARTGRPRIIIFNDQLGFTTGMFFSIWNDRLMVKTAADPGKLDLLYRPPLNGPLVRESIPATLYYLVGMMAFRPTQDSTTPGLDLSYQQIVEALHKMTRQGFVQAPFVLQRDTLAEQINRRRISEQQPEERPDTSADRPEKKFGN